MRFDWLVFVFFCVLLVLVPPPVTRLQWGAFVVAIMFLMLMALVLFEVVGTVVR